MNTFSIKIDHQLNPSNLINERVFYGRNFSSAPAGNSGEIIPPGGPADLFNSVTDPTVAALVGIFLSPGANALDVAKTVKTEVAELATRCRDACIPSFLVPLSRITDALRRHADKLASAH